MLGLLSDVAVIAFLIVLGIGLEWAWHRLRRAHDDRQARNRLPG